MKMNLIKFIKSAKKRGAGYSKGDYTNYFAFQKYQAEEVIKEIKKRGINLSKLSVLELAVGIGGYSLTIKEHSKDLTINDIREPYVIKLYPSLNFKKFNVMEKYPFKDNSFDFVFCSSLIEHVNKPEKMLYEIRRVLKPGGYLYLSFPPFYTPIGGHELKPFHLLGNKISLKIYNFLHNKKIKSYENFYVREYATYGLHKRTIWGVKKLLKNKGFKISHIWTRFFPINTANIPLINEFITWHVCFLCKNKK